MPKVNSRGWHQISPQRIIEVDVHLSGAVQRMSSCTKWRFTQINQNVGAPSTGEKVRRRNIVRYATPSQSALVENETDWKSKNGTESFNLTCHGSAASASVCCGVAACIVNNRACPGLTMKPALFSERHDHRENITRTKPLA